MSTSGLSGDTRASAGRNRLWQPRLAMAALALLALLLLLPLLVTGVLSFQLSGNTDPFAGPYGLSGWSSLLQDPALWPVLLRSIGQAILIGIVASLLAVAPAYLAAVIGGTWRRVVLILCLLVLLGDQVTVVMGWSEIGRQAVRWLIDPDASSGRYAIGDLMTFLAETHRALPLAVLCQIWAMRRHDPALIEMGLECGAHHGRLLRFAVWPWLRPGLWLGGLVGFTLSLGASLEPALLNTGTPSWGERLQQALEIDSDWPQGAQLALLALVALLLAIGITACFLARVSLSTTDRQPDQTGSARPAYRLDLRDPLLSAAVISLGFLALPLLWMLVLSLRYFAGIIMAAGPGLFVQAIIEDPRLLPAIGTSLATALMAGLLAAGGGAGLAMWWRYLLARDVMNWLTALLVLLGCLPFIMPGLLLSTLHLAAHLFLAIYLPSGLGILAVALADGLRAMPMVAVILLMFWQRLPDNLDETVAEFGLDVRRIYRLILQPSLQPAWAIGILATVLLSLGDFQLANALSGERQMLAPSLLAGIATQRSPIYLALTGPLLVLTVWLCHLILRRLDHREQRRAPHGNAGGLGLSLNITARKT